MLNLIINFYKHNSTYQGAIFNFINETYLISDFICASTKKNDDIMLPELGFFLLLLATASAFFLTLVPQFGLFKKNPTLINAAWPLSYIFTLATTLSIGLLAYSFAVDDFTLEYVAAHSNSQLPTFFKVAATWGGHEGSMLFWLFSLSLWLAAFAFFNRKNNRTFPLNLYLYWD